MARRALLLLIVAAAFAGLVPVAGAHCIKRHQVRIADGTSPSGWPWSVTGSIGDNGNHCRDWLFGMDFELQGALSWGWSTGIPAGGHLSRTEIDANDDLLVDGSDRVFSGTVDGEVAKVLLTLSNNKHISIRPRRPPLRLRRKVDWLRNVGYIVRYYPPEGFVTGVATFSRSGVLLYRDRSFEGY
jgi:hypothetical protein